MYGDDNADGDCRTSDVDWISATVITSGLSGNTLEIRLTTTNYAGTEYIRFDNIEVTYTSALPVELINYSVIANSPTSVLLNWQTASELNNDFFTVERSHDGENWEAIDFIDGQGNSSILSDYSTIDKNPLSGTSYYRLKQTDFDGQYTYSKTESVVMERIQNTSISVYPNPSNDQITISGNKNELSTIQIFNNLGVDVTELTNSISGETTKKVLDISELSVGLYYIKTKTATRMISVF